LVSAVSRRENFGVAEDKQLLAFLLSGSRITLQDAMLAHLAAAQNARKQALEALELWIEESVNAELLSWFLANEGQLRAGLDIFRLPKKPPAPIRRMLGIRRKQLRL
jgi:hypothetical protein